MILRERCKLAGFSINLLLPLLGLLGHLSGFHWLAVVMIFGAVSLFNKFIIEDDLTNSDAMPTFQPWTLVYLNALPAAYVVVWIASLFWTAHTLATESLSLIQQVGLLLAAGIGSAFSTCISHELVHGRGWFERLMCRVGLTVCWHGSFLLEHLHHHRTVGYVDIGGTPKLG